MYLVVAFLFLIIVSYCINSNFYCSGENVTENIKKKFSCFGMENFMCSC